MGDKYIGAKLNTTKHADILDWLDTNEINRQGLIIHLFRLCMQLGITQSPPHSAEQIDTPGVIPTPENEDAILADIFSALNAIT